MDNKAYNELLKQRCETMEKILENSKIENENFKDLCIKSENQYQQLKKESKEIDTKLENLLKSI